MGKHYNLWFFTYESETKHQSKHQASMWKTPRLLRLKKARKSKSKFKTTNIVFFFFDNHGNV